MEFKHKFTLADHLRALGDPKSTAAKVIESYRGKSKLLENSIESHTPLLELVRPVFARALDELEKTSPWFEPPYTRTREYQDLVEDLHNNLIGNIHLNMRTSSSVPIKIPSYIGWIKDEAPWSYPLAIASTFLVLPWIIHICDVNKRRKGITKEVFSLSPQTKFIQDINYIDDAVRKYYFPKLFT